MVAPSVARPRSLPRFSGLAWRRARWGYVFIAPWLIGFVLFTALPMIATFVFSFTNINLAQTEPLQFVGLDNYETLLGDQQVWTSLGITLKFAALALPVAVVAAVPRRAAARTRGTSSRSGVFRVLFFLPFVVPFVATVFIWGGMLNPETGWINAGLEALGVERPARLARGPRLGLPGPRPHRGLGHRRRDDRLPGRAQGRPDRPVRGGADRWRRGVGVASATSPSRCSRR